MQEILLHRLHDYMRHCNPDQLIRLQAQGKVTEYLTDKVKLIDPLLNEMLLATASPLAIEEVCMNVLTEDLKPSKYLYIQEILLEFFGATYVQWQRDNILLYEIINILDGCASVLRYWHLPEEHPENLLRRHAVEHYIREYIKTK